MTTRRYLLLTPHELEQILKDFGFTHQRTIGSHAQWDGVTYGVRRICTVQKIKGTYSTRRMKTVIENLGVTPQEFYSKNKKIGKRYQGK